ncbi:hypothetical protein HP439_05550 [Sphingobacterium shayense]|uniref:hypothetical protein n=1 Tax=Sphingobacterium shayense TaxID=626343 RepID=UPI001555A704|nr:hypothetical protein [Sphingobacterium shayense]NQD70183.1 hypothetical protein [Sphingobacterium shayense]
MSNFATIKFIQKYKKVVYYSVVENGDEDDSSIFELFLQKFGVEERNKLNHVLSWIREIGNKYGAQSHLFRNENNAAALPPRGVTREPSYIENEEEKANPLRLYCHRLNEHVVILFGGGIKTAPKVQNCDNVRMPFILANKLSKMIDENIRSGEIGWTDDYYDIAYEDSFKLYY